MKLLCKLFGHKFYFPDDIYETLICKRCGIKVEDYWDKQFGINNSIHETSTSQTLMSQRTCKERNDE